MEPRTDIQNRFVTRFHLGDPPTPVAEQFLDEIETALDTRLPTSYRLFMTRHGVVHSPTILKSLVALGLDHPDVRDFFSPQEVIDDTRGYWSAGMPKDVIGIASDCMGNMIGFRRQPARSDDAPVVFFDHDYLVVRNLAKTFDEFLLWYLDQV